MKPAAEGPMKLTIEVCADSLESALNAQKGGADRIELCENLSHHGTTPSQGMIEVARAKLRIGLHVMIRPRGGDFSYTSGEYDVMKKDIMVAKKNKADGVVFGILQKDFNVDVRRTRALVRLARPLTVTFHRAIDITPDPIKALGDVISAGADRILTSGQKESVIDGMPVIRKMIEFAEGRIIIMLTGGIKSSNLRSVLKTPGISEIHVGSSVFGKSGHSARKMFLFPRNIVSPGKVKKILSSLE